MSGKMVMFMAWSMVNVYLCLLIRTFESKSQPSKENQNEDQNGALKISKTNAKCIALGRS